MSTLIGRAGLMAAALMATVGLVGSAQGARLGAPSEPVFVPPSSFGRGSQRRKPRKRLAPAIHGGNWQGVEYLTCREHDRVNRLCRFPAYMTRAEALKRVKSERPA